ncbi:hypothetical protein [Sinomonas sp. P10A9]|uniref:DUF4381 domain-containing protein n=1 Tax=Sinomonas puerhi TaxID=3238584 RepID=A0AB39L5W7_9MICC
MPPSPSPSPIDVIVHSDPAAWWQMLAPYAPLLAAVIAGWIAWKALKQRSLADNRAEWWRRAQWALDASMSAEPRRREMGQQAIDRLGQSPLAGPEDLDFLEIGTEDALEDADAARHAEAMAMERTTGRKSARTDAGIQPSNRPASVSPEDRRVQIAAAKARITLDERRGLATPDWIVALSLEKPE